MSALSHTFFSYNLTIKKKRKKNKDKSPLSEKKFLENNVL